MAIQGAAAHPACVSEQSFIADRKLRIGDAFCSSVKADGIHSDLKLKGFCLRVRGNSKMFIARAKLRGTRTTVLVTIGSYPKFSASDARRIARGHLNDLANGINPNDKRKDETAKLEAKKAVEDDQALVREITIRKVFSDYLSSRKLKDTTVYGYKCTLRSTLADWLDKPRILRALFTCARITYDDANSEPIITSNPVTRLSQARIWNRSIRRQTVIRSHELSAWCKAVMALENKTVRDYLLLLLFTGLRKSEAAQLLWQNVDLKGATLLIPDP